jgi:nucleotide sugar dehydrogenase
MNNIGIIGVGKLGLPYALTFEQAGFNVYASSYRSDYVKELTDKTFTTTEPGVNDMLNSAVNIKFTTDNHEVISNCDIIYVMVATPSTPQGDYDVSAVTQVAQDYLTHPHSVAGKILIVGSTVNPGDCKKLQEALDPVGVHVVYSPTFVAQGRVLEMIKDPRTLSIGTNLDSVYQRCYDLFVKIVNSNTEIFQLDPTSAEILKLAGNARATMLISFFNSIGQLLIKQGLEKDLAAASLYLNFIKEQERWKFGFGYGGPCYPRDNRAIEHYARSIDMEYPFASVTDQFNQQHVGFLTEFLIQKNSQNHAYYFEYLSYKPGVAMFDESQQLQICKNLLDSGATVYAEPSVFLTADVVAELESQYPKLFSVCSMQSLQDQNIATINVMRTINR